jgi:hypothetical protein
MSCTNSPDRCVTNKAYVVYELDPSLGSTTGPANLAVDMESTILPAWNHVTPHSPLLAYCSAPCTEDVLVKAVAGSDPDLNYAGSVTVRDGGFTSGTPAQFLHQTIKVAISYYDHSCPQGCSGAHLDDRAVFGHETGHTIGLGHCDLNNVSMMCAAQSTPTNPLDFNGTHFWAPRPTDLQAIAALYP